MKYDSFRGRLSTGSLVPKVFACRSVVWAANIRALLRCTIQYRTRVFVSQALPNLENSNNMVRATVASSDQDGSQC